MPNEPRMLTAQEVERTIRHNSCDHPCKHEDCEDWQAVERFLRETQRLAVEVADTLIRQHDCIASYGGGIRCSTCDLTKALRAILPPVPPRD